MNDIIADVFRLIRFKSCVYFLAEFAGPWAMDIPKGPFAQFHVITRGRGIIEHDGKAHELGPGDVLLLAKGDAHILADAPGRKPVSGQSVVAAITKGEPMFDHGEMATQLICGHFEYRGELPHPLLLTLPGLIHIKGAGRSAPLAIDTILPLLMRELDKGEPGSRVVAERLAEVLLVQTLRAQFSEPSTEAGFLAAGQDQRLCRAIAAIHTRYADPLSLDELARTAGMSRSMFATRFKAVLGESPVAYLTRWRMLEARELVVAEGLSTAAISHRVGYESDIAFGRAFKRLFGQSPAALRREGMEAG